MKCRCGAELVDSDEIEEHLRWLHRELASRYVQTEVDALLAILGRALVKLADECGDEAVAKVVMPGAWRTDRGG